MKLLLTSWGIIFLTAVAGAAVFNTNVPDKDSFVRQLGPTLNYGGGGAMAVSGTNATVNNPTNGAFDGFMSFNTHAMATNFNAVLGTNNWVISSATLILSENPNPDNPLFNFGLGNFQIRWIANDTWVEGTGTPMAPTMNGVTYAQEPTYLNSAVDENLGTFDFTNGATTGCSLALAPSFVTNMMAGGEVGFFMTAIDASMAFVVYSHDFKGNQTLLPHLVVSAAVQPRISQVTTSGSNLILTATNGTANGTYYTLASTNLTTSVNLWTPVATNVLSSGGTFSVTLTNALGTNTPQFFILRTY